MRNNKPSAWRDILEILAFFAVCAILIWLMLTAIKAITDYVRAEAADGQLKADTVNEGDGVGRATACLNGVLLLGGETDMPVRSTALRVYTEGVDNPMPEWWNPDEPMAVEWYVEDHFAETGNMVEAEPHPPAGVDPGGIDYNLCTTLWGWDGHSMEAWEMDLFSMIFYREFWQPNLTLCEAGCDAILQLWDLNGGAMFETLSHVNEDGSYAFSTYPGVWEAEYDPDGLAWCRAYCEERFYEGPSWPAQYFRKGQYHDWDEWSPIPAYEIDGIYFSIGR